jgi:hypothetical protein
MKDGKRVDRVAIKVFDEAPGEGYTVDPNNRYVLHHDVKPKGEKKSKAQKDQELLDARKKVQAHFDGLPEAYKSMAPNVSEMKSVSSMKKKYYFAFGLTQAPAEKSKSRKK